MTLRGIPLEMTRARDIQVRDGKIISLGPCSSSRSDTGSSRTIIAPLLFDIQVNGVGGIDLQAGDVAPEDVVAITRKLAAQGVSRWVPTVITGPAKRMERTCRVIAETMSDREVKRAVPGIHLEGPYISPHDGPRGAHAKRHVRKPNIREFDAFLEAADGKILYTTVAPEVPGAIPYIRAVVRRGVVAALGHCAAKADDIERAVDAGARLSTHLGNGLASTIHRHDNPLWPQLSNDALTASLIADLHHLPPSMLKTFVRAKGPGNIVLTSDAVHLAGMKPGPYRLGGVPVELKRSGRICLTGTDLLAGSSLSLLQGVINAAQHSDMTVEQAFASASSIPLKLFGLRPAPWPPKVGRKANFILFDLDKSKTPWRPHIRKVFINGRVL